jgi:hypothetical protein
MLWEEWRVPVEKRYLSIEGIAEEKVCEELFTGYQSKKGLNIISCFISYSYADLSMGKRFDTLYKDTEPLNFVITPVTVIAATQQLAHETDFVPYGWKTVCMLEFSEGVPEIVRNMPTVSSWFESDLMDNVRLCNQETYQARKALGLLDEKNFLNTSKH